MHYWHSDVWHESSALNTTSCQLVIVIEEPAAFEVQFKALESCGRFIV